MFISPNILATLLGVILVGLISLISWIVKQINEHARFLAAMKVTQIDHGDRLRMLEANYFARPHPHQPFDQDQDQDQDAS